MVTPTYYVYFTSTTIITSAVLFRGFKGTPTSIVTVVNGFLTICSGVVLLQLSKSAKDVPDAAVFKGDLDQIQTIAEQEQPETEPKADAIRGAAAIVRRFSVTRQKMEIEELRRLHEEKRREQLEPLNEEGPQQYEWDGIRRRRTVNFGNVNPSTRSRAGTVTSPFIEQPSAHPPLGMSHFPTEEELAEQERQSTPGILSSIAGTIRNRARSVRSPSNPDFPRDPKVQSPMHPVPLTEIAVPAQKPDDEAGSYFGKSREHVYGLPAGLQHTPTAYQGAGSQKDLRNPSSGSGTSGQSGLAPTPPAHSARRQFSFQNVFRRHQHDGSGQQQAQRDTNSRAGLGSRGYSSPQVKGATEEERLGLVKGDSQSMPVLPRYDDEEEDEPYVDEDKEPRPIPTVAASSSTIESRYGRGITTPPRRGSDDRETEIADYEASRRRFNESRGSNTPPPPPSDRKRSPPGGGDGAFI
jgi:magnesium transporter